MPLLDSGGDRSGSPLESGHTSWTARGLVRLDGLGRLALVDQEEDIYELGAKFSSGSLLIGMPISSGFPQMGYLEKRH
jgi:hypothetical protein